MGTDVLVDLDSPEVRANPWPTFAWLRSHAPVYKLPTRDVWAISRYADVARALRDFETYSSQWNRSVAPLPTRTLLHLDPPAHTRLRRLVAPRFSGRRIGHLRERIEVHAESLLDRLAGAGRCELIDDFANPLPVAIIAELLGAPLDQADELKHWSTSMVRYGPGGENVPESLRGTSFEDEARRGSEALLAYVEQLIADHRSRPRDDLTSSLIALQEEGRITADELTMFCRQLFSAGHFNTTNLIGNGVQILAEDQALWQRLQSDPTLVPAFVEEVLRYDPPLLAARRITTRPVELEGQQIPSGARVVLLIGAANRDPARFQDPDTFNVDRFGAEREYVGLDHFAFGAGVHLCLGAPLARLEADVVFRALLRRLRAVHLESGFDPQTVRITDVGHAVNGYRILPIVFDSA